MLSFCPFLKMYTFFHFFLSVIVDSVAQLLASGSVGDGETNGYYSLVVVIELLGEKRRQQSGLEMKWQDNRQTI